MDTTVTVVIEPRFAENYSEIVKNWGYNIQVGIPRVPKTGGTAITISTVENASNWLKEVRRFFTDVRPVLIGDAPSLIESKDLSVASAPVLPAGATADDLMRILAFLARNAGWLFEELSKLHKNTVQLVEQELCEWVRSRPGIIGITRLARFPARPQLRSLIKQLIQHSYAALDSLPKEKLTFQDMWNITLLIAVPIKESEVDRESDLFKELDAVSRDVSGSRKTILWFDRTVADHFGPVGEGHDWQLATDDPLRRSLDELASDPVEREVLKNIFKRKLSQSDIDELLRVLSRSM
jgi:hypothetical protein